MKTLPLDPKRLKRELAKVKSRSPEKPITSYNTKNATSSIADHIKTIFSSAKIVSPDEWAAMEFRDCIQPRVKACGFRDRYLNEIPMSKPQKSVYDLCRDKFKQVGAIVAIVGLRGNGKTTIASQLTINAVKKWWDWHSKMPEDREGPCPVESFPRYTKLADMVGRYKSLYADFGSINAEKLMEERDRRTRETALTIIDEIHECEDQKLKHRVLTDWIDRCYSSKKDVLLISNQTEAEFRRTISDSVLSRLTEHGMIVGCNWPSFRGA